MTQYDNSATLVWPASFEGSDKVLDPHVTAVYMGDKRSLTAEPGDLINVLQPLGSAPADTEVTGVEVFGRYKVSDLFIVATLDPGHLALIREFIKMDLHDDLGIEDASSYPDYRPHVTLGTVAQGASVIPEVVSLGRLELWWGDERYQL